MSDLKIKLRSAATLEFAGANGKTVVVDVESGVQSVDSQAEANKATFAKCTTAWLTNDLETLKSTMASDCTVTFNGPTGAGPLVNRTWYGHDGLMQYLTEIYCESRFTKFEHREITADGQYIYATSCMDYVTRSTGKCAKGVNMNFKIEFNDDGLMKKWVFTYEDSDVAINQYKLHGVSRTVMTIKSGQMDEFVKRYETLIPQIKQFPGT